MSVGAIASEILAMTGLVHSLGNRRGARRKTRLEECSLTTPLRPPSGATVWEDYTRLAISARLNAISLSWSWRPRRKISCELGRSQ